ncbi:DinB family protein [Actinocrispum sp. NPDC049592]|uniref:DinB family protein n=1 Tax=Actinocrispum sp. NPDC049592 TaxID=3154835 RepID=UPI00341825D9
MTWTVPELVRVDEPHIADERTMLDGWLDWHRATLVRKCAGLTAEELARRSVPPSTLSLQGLIRHMTDVERMWFRKRFLGEDIDLLYVTEDDDTADLLQIDPATAEAEFTALVDEWNAVRTGIAGACLDDLFTHERGGQRSLRWIYIHLIEEYARHNGHADMLRECIDGVTGD